MLLLITLVLYFNLLISSYNSFWNDYSPAIKKSKYWCIVSVDTFDWYLFQLIAILKPDFNYSSSFALSWVDKVTTGT